jgi:hypothetical protein
MTESAGRTTGESPTLDGSDGSGGSGGSLEGVLTDIRAWFRCYISVTDDLDLDLLTLWTAHTHVALETYTTPRLILDSTMPGSGKTTVLEHLNRLCMAPVQAASLSSPALLTRMLNKGIRTILIDEVDRSLDPKKPGVEDLIAVLNSGYKRGATRPVLVPGKGGEWDVAEMPTYSPVAMAGNAPNLPDDTRSRSIRVLLMPDLQGLVESSDWEEIEPDARDLAEALANAMEEAREHVRTVRPELPAGCIGRIKERWNPLMRVAVAAGGEWPGITAQLIERDMREAEMEREDGLTKLPPAVVLLGDLHGVWPEGEVFVRSSALVEGLIAFNAGYWGAASAYGHVLTVQRFGKLLTQAFKVFSSKSPEGVRGYRVGQFEKVWQRFGIIPLSGTARTAGTVRTVQTESCSICGQGLWSPKSQAEGICAKRDHAHLSRGVA